MRKGLIVGLVCCCLLNCNRKESAALAEPAEKNKTALKERVIKGTVSGPTERIFSDLPQTPPREKTASVSSPLDQLTKEEPALADALRSSEVLGREIENLRKQLREGDEKEREKARDALGHKVEELREQLKKDLALVEANLKKYEGRFSADVRELVGRVNDSLRFASDLLIAAFGGEKRELFRKLEIGEQWRGVEQQIGILQAAADLCVRTGRIRDLCDPLRSFLEQVKKEIDERKVARDGEEKGGSYFKTALADHLLNRWNIPKKLGVAHAPQLGVNFTDIRMREKNYQKVVPEMKQYLHRLVTGAPGLAELKKDLLAKLEVEKKSVRDTQMLLDRALVSYVKALERGEGVEQTLDQLHAHATAHFKTTGIQEKLQEIVEILNQYEGRLNKTEEVLLFSVAQIDQRLGTLRRDCQIWEGKAALCEHMRKIPQRITSLEKEMMESQVLIAELPSVMLDATELTRKMTEKKASEEYGAQPALSFVFALSPYQLHLNGGLAASGRKRVFAHPALKSPICDPMKQKTLTLTLRSWTVPVCVEPGITLYAEIFAPHLLKHLHAGHLDALKGAVKEATGAKTVTLKTEEGQPVLRLFHDYPCQAGTFELVEMWRDFAKKVGAIPNLIPLLAPQNKEKEVKKGLAKELVKQVSNLQDEYGEAILQGLKEGELDALQQEMVEQLFRVSLPMVYPEMAEQIAKNILNKNVEYFAKASRVLDEELNTKVGRSEVEFGIQKVMENFLAFVIIGKAHWKQEMAEYETKVTYWCVEDATGSGKWRRRNAEGPLAVNREKKSQHKSFIIHDPGNNYYFKGKEFSVVAGIPDLSEMPPLEKLFESLEKPGIR